jgi:hypothetical protein
MTQLTMSTTKLPRVEKPPCFGDAEEWDPEDVACTGGMDPLYRHENGSKVRDRCFVFEACGARAQAAKLEPNQARLLDPKSLLGHRTPQPSAAGSFNRAFSSAYSPPSNVSTSARPVLGPSQPAPAPLATVPRPQVPAPYVPPTHVPPGYHLPPFLLVPEPRGEDSFWSFIVRTAARAVGKALGHSIAHVFDTHPLKPPER